MVIIINNKKKHKQIKYTLVYQTDIAHTQDRIDN